MKLRLKYYDRKGWILEHGESKWTIFGIKTIWKPVTTYAGLSKPFYYDSAEEARDRGLDALQEEIVFRFYFPYLERF